MSNHPGHVLTVAELEHALDQGGLVAVYQPCYDLRTGQLVAVEALARLREPATQELIAPARFIPTAEDSGLVTRLDLLMIDQAFRQVAAWRTTPPGRDLCVSINLSPADLDDPDIATRIRLLAEDAGLPIDAVIVELTETVLAESSRGHDDALASIADLGCNVTLDDFGTGNASFAYLQRFHVNGLKIDRSFVQSLGEGGPNDRLAESLIRFCLSLNVHVVAEGIEEAAHIAALRRLGCPFGQGFLLARPMTAQQLDASFRAGVVEAAVLRGAPLPEPAPLVVDAVGATRSRTPLLAALVVLLMVALAGLSFTGQRRAEASLREAAMEHLSTVDSLAAGQVDTNVALIRNAVADSVTRPTTRRAIVDRDGPALEAELFRIMSTPSEIYSASFYDVDATMLALQPAVPGVVGQNFSYRDWYRGARASAGAYVSEAFQLKTPDAPWAIAISESVRDRAGRPVGFLVGTYVLAGLQKELEAALADHGVTATLVDGRGTLLAAPGGRGPRGRSLGEPTLDPRLLAQRAATGYDGAADSHWVVKPVPSLAGWLLAEQPCADASAVSPTAGRIGTVVVGLLAAGVIGLVLLWARADRRRRRLEAELAAAHDWLSTVLASTPTPLVVCDDAGRVQSANDAMAALLGASADRLVGDELCSWLPLDGQPRTDDGVVTTSVVTSDAQVRVVEVRTQLLHGPRGDAMHLHTVVDVTPHREEHDRLRAQGRTDPLTGAGNRRALREALQAAHEDTRSPYAVVMMDLDGFKQVNDTLGHARGDELLSLVARTLRETVRPEDTVTRVGGDEFVTVVRLADHDQCPAVAERLEAAVVAALVADPAARSAGVGVSTGTAVIGRDGTDIDELLFVADQRMYVAKRARGTGRGAPER